jgi:hypothetical protein
MKASRWLLIWNLTMTQRPTRFRQRLLELTPLSERLRQVGLVDKSQLFAVLCDFGFADYGMTDRFEALLKELFGDSPGPDGPDEFHPFRFYTVFRALQKGSAGALNSSEDDETIDLAILLEPIYWPEITYRNTSNVGGDEYWPLLDEYKNHVWTLLQQEDANKWKLRHENLLRIGTRVDSNRELYLLLRLSGWDQRSKLTGRVSAALWIRHIAEVIRRGFEKAHGVVWPEEDRAFDRLRSRLLGSERLLDQPALSRRHIARRFELFSGSAVRWYVEGPTEYYAILEALGDPALFGVEIVNLAGRIERDRDNIALNMKEWLEEDIRLKRFSIISFDADVRQNVKTIGSLCSSVVGSIFAHKPDFEFANFTLDELVHVAAELDKTEGFDSASLGNSDWTGIATGKAFENRYLAVSNRGRALKGEKWGRALARYAEERPNGRDGVERPFTVSLRHAVLAQTSNWDHHKDSSVINPKTFRSEPRQNPGQ